MGSKRETAAAKAPADGGAPPEKRKDRQLELIPGLLIAPSPSSSHARAIDGIARIAHWEANRLQSLARTRATLAKEGEPTADDVRHAIAEIRTAGLEMLSLVDTFVLRIGIGQKVSR